MFVIFDTNAKQRQGLNRAERTGLSLYIIFTFILTLSEFRLMNHPTWVFTVLFVTKFSKLDSIAGTGQWT
jgi:hypothetical protein